MGLSGVQVQGERLTLLLLLLECIISLHYYYYYYSSVLYSKKKKRPLGRDIVYCTRRLGVLIRVFCVVAPCSLYMHRCAPTCGVSLYARACADACWAVTAVADVARYSLDVG